MTDLPRRSLVKAVVWRACAFVALLFIAWSVSGRLEVGAWTSMIYHALAVTMYFLYERLWSRVGWGVELTVRDFVRRYGPLKGRLYFRLIQLMEEVERRGRDTEGAR